MARGFFPGVVAPPNTPQPPKVTCGTQCPPTISANPGDQYYNTNPLCTCSEWVYAYGILPGGNACGPYGWQWVCTSSKVSANVQAINAITTSGIVVSTSMTIAQAQNTVIQIVGVLTGNAAITIPFNQGVQQTIHNLTSGAFTVTIGGPTGARVTVAQGTAQLVYNDGTNFYAVS